MSKLLTKEAVWAADDLLSEKVEVEEWGGHLWVRSLTGLERDEFETQMIDTREGNRELNLRNIRASLVARAACDEKGVRLFSNADVTKLGAKSAAALDKVYSVASRLSGLSSDDEEELVDADFSEAPEDSTTP